MSGIRQVVLNAARAVEAALTPRKRLIHYNNRRLRVVRSLWWDDTTQEAFDAEILPYFAELRGRTDYSTVLDVGAATGMFSLAAASAFNDLRQLVAFEPSLRQRILLLRNVRSNHAATARIVSAALWSTDGTMPFRTHGALSSIKAASSLPKSYAFFEHVSVVTLDSWVNQNLQRKVDLIKMDVEGAEIEALQGARGTLVRDGPELLIQAYHLRNGQRTFEHCAGLLREIGYTCREAAGSPGLLHGIR